MPFLGLSVDYSDFIVELRDLEHVSVLLEVIAILIFQPKDGPLCTAEDFNAQ